MGESNVAEHIADIDRRLRQTAEYAAIVHRLAMKSVQREEKRKPWMDVVLAMLIGALIGLAVLVLTVPLPPAACKP